MWPEQADIAQATAQGTPLFRGLPVAVEAERRVAALNLVAVLRGDSDPWFTIETPRPGVVDLRTAGDRGLYVGGMPVSADDMGPVLSAIRVSPDRTDRHDADANQARLEAGKIAMRIQDSMVRARVLDAVDGWAALRETGTVLDDSKDDGVLIRPSTDLELTCYLLVVTCPSTGRIYAHRVPTTFTTAKEARTWMMNGITPEVET